MAGAILIRFQILLIYSVSVFAISKVCVRKTTVNDKTMTVYFCCSHYVLRNTGCVECPLGYRSKDGSSCYPCGPKNYGERCGYVCYCAENQTCHHIYGCFETSTEIMKNKTNKYKYTKETLTKIINVSTAYGQSTSETTNVALLDDENITQDNNMKSEKGFSRIEIVIYTTATCCVVLVLLFCSLKHGYLIERRNRNVELTVNESRHQTQHEIVNTRHQSSGFGANVYHTIDDTLLDEILTPDEIFTTERVRSEADDLENNQDDTSSYLHPYHSLLQSEVNLEDYKTISIYNETSFTDSDTDKEEDDGYLNPYELPSRRQITNKNNDLIAKADNTIGETTERIKIITLSRKSNSSDSEHEQDYKIYFC